LKTPPAKEAELSLSVLLAICSVPRLMLAPPLPAELPLNVLLVIVNVPAL
jgi:hypothetical protein